LWLNSDYCMILIADSGSTKTTWALIDTNAQLNAIYHTSGINPYQQDEKSIIIQLAKELQFSQEVIQQVYYYGAGATSASSKRLEHSLGNIFKNAYFIGIQSDISAAAHALCEQNAGIACILGTGSNSCLYNGKRITNNIGGFGFILGDEGSGGVLGRQLMGDYLHKNMPKHLWQKLQDDYKLSPNLILDKVYRQSYPNRFLAGFAPFLHQNLQESYIKTLVKTQFQLFFDKKVLCYKPSNQLPIHFTGSIAYYFKQILEEIAANKHLKIGNIVQTPINGLIRYHQTKMN